MTFASSFDASDELGAAPGELLGSLGAVFALELEAGRVLKVGRATVVRARSVGGGVVGGVVMKRFDSAHRRHFLRERAALRLLGGVRELRGFMPALLAEDEASLSLLMPDVSDQGSLSDLVASADPEKLAQRLSETAERLGVLHAHARALVPAFQALVSDAATPGKQLRDGAAATLGFLERALVHAPSAAGSREFAAGSLLDAELHDLAARVDEPGALHTLTLGDLAPSNVLVGFEAPIFIDFEYAGARHAFYDAMFWHCIYPVSEGAAERMDAAYRSGLRGAGVAMDDERFYRELWLFACQRLFWSLGWGMQALFEQDRELVPGVSTRLTLLQYLREHIRLAAKLPELERHPLSRVVARLEPYLSSIW